MIISLWIETMSAYVLLLSVAVLTDDKPIKISCLIWLSVTAISYIINRVFLKKERALASVYILNVILFIISCVVMLTLTEGINSFLNFILLMIFVLIISSRIMYVVLHPFTERNALTHFEIAFAQSAVYFIFYDSGVSMTLQGTICIIASLILGLFAMITSNMGRQARTARELTTVGIVFAILVGSAVLLRNEVGNFSKAAINGSGKVLSFAGSKIIDFLMLLANPVEDQGAHIIAETSSSSTSDYLYSNIEARSYITVLIFGIGIIAVLILAFIIRAIIKSLKNRAGGTASIKVQDSVTIVRTSAKKKLLKNIQYKIKYFLFWLKNKNNALGALLWLEKKYRKTEFAKSKDVTITEFFKELRNDENKFIFDKLTEILNRYFYCESDKGSLNFPEIKEFKKTLCNKIDKLI